MLAHGIKNFIRKHQREILNLNLRKTAVNHVYVFCLGELHLSRMKSSELMQIENIIKLLFNCLGSLGTITFLIIYGNAKCDIFQNSMLSISLFSLSKSLFFDRR